MNGYLLLKWIHVLMAITALGTNITYGLWLSRAAREPNHLAFALKGIKLLDDRIANPAYGLLLLTGLAMAGVGRIPLTTPWLQLGMTLYVLVVVIAATGYSPTLRRQIQSLDAGGPNAPEYQRLAARATLLGIVLVVLVVIIVFIMVTKPALWG
ncbi:MAG TPA: DUF2269 family protein [Candidatus Acidoferrales bacterium]|jgi:uncharacterized membrane protein|nr:DUF2269 family protein [Candidatus Acidoferrales bacterium]